MPAVVTVEASVSLGISSSGGAAPRLVVGPDGGVVVAVGSVVATTVVAVPTVLAVELAGVSVALSSPQAPANTRPAAATQCTRRRRRRAERVRRHPLLFTPCTLAAVGP